MTVERVVLLALKGSSSNPAAEGRRSLEYRAMVEALEEAVSLLEGRKALSWDGPDHPSLSWDLELEDWVEVGIHEFASVLQFSFSIVAPRETGLSKSVLTVRDERLPRGWLRTRTPAETQETVLSLLREWRTMCAGATIVDRGPGTKHELPESMRDAARTTIARFGALAEANGMDAALGCPGMELMWHLRHPTEHGRATLCGSASGNEEATFDDRTMDAVFEGLPPAIWITRDASAPVSIRIAPYAWSVGSLEETDPMSVLRTLKSMDLDWKPEVLTKEENA